MTKSRRDVPNVDPDLISIALILIAAASGVATIISPIQVSYHERKRRQREIGDAKARLKESVYSIERSLFDLQAALKSFNSILDQYKLHATKFLPGQVIIGDEDALYALSKLKDRIYSVSGAIDDEIGEVATILRELQPDTELKDFKLVRDKMMTAYKKALNCETLGDFIGATDSYLTSAFEILGALKEKYDL